MPKHFIVFAESEDEFVEFKNHLQEFARHLSYCSGVGGKGSRYTGAIFLDKWYLNKDYATGLVLHEKSDVAPMIEICYRQSIQPSMLESFVLNVRSGMKELALRDSSEAERMTHNHEVEGSSPSPATRISADAIKSCEGVNPVGI